MQAGCPVPQRQSGRVGGGGEGRFSILAMARREEREGGGSGRRRTRMAERGKLDHDSGRLSRAKLAPRRMSPPGTVMLPRKTAVCKGGGEGEASTRAAPAVLEVRRGEKDRRVKGRIARKGRGRGESADGRIESRRGWASRPVRKA